MQYQPLDLSFLSNYANQQNSTQSVARYILDNGGWTKNLAQQEYDAILKKQAASLHQGGGIQRLWDLLNLGTYTVANAAYEGIAGHQSDSNDSVLHDIGTTLGGVGTGAARGALASLRGATSGLIPGLGSDEYAAETFDKTHFGDVLSKWYLGMDAAQANDPANRAKVIEKLTGARRNMLLHSKENLLYPNGVSDQDAADFLTKIAWAGIASDVVSDPLNLVNPFGWVSKVKGLTQLSKGAAELPEEARRALNVEPQFNKFDQPERMLNSGIHEAIPTGTSPLSGVPTYSATSPRYLSSKLTPKFKTPDLPSGAYRVIPSAGTPESIVNSMKSGGRIEWPKGFKPKIEPRPPRGFEIAPKIQKTIIKRILTHAALGEKNWHTKAVNDIQGLIGAHDLPRTFEFIDRVRQIAQKNNTPIQAYVRRMRPDLANKVKEDVAALRATGTEEERARYMSEIMTAQRLVNSPEIADIILEKFKAPPPKLPRQGEDIAANTIRKYYSRVVGNAAPTIERSPGAINKAIATGRNARYSGPQQVNMYQTILKNLKYAKTGVDKAGNEFTKFAHATDILKRVENYFEAKNAVPYSSFKLSESIPLKLSAVLEAIGPEAANMSRQLLTKILKGDENVLAEFSPEVLQKLEIAKAGESLATAPGVKAGIEHGKQEADLLSKAPYSEPRKIDAWTNVIRNTKSSAIAAGGGEVGAWIAGKYLKDAFNLASPIAHAYKSERFGTEAFLANAAKNDARFAKVDIKNITKLNRAISKAADLPMPVQAAKAIGTGARTVEWLGARFNAAYGNADMRPLFLAHQASAFSTAAIRSKFVNDLGKQFDARDIDLWNSAFKSAQGNLAPIGGAVDELAIEIQRTMENLFGGSGLREGAIAEATVIGRSRLLMSDLNQSMKRFGLHSKDMKFTAAAKVKGADGIVRNYSKGADWLKSWESWTVENPYKFLHQMQSAVEYAVREKMLFDEIISRFGAFKKLPGGVKYGVNHPRFQGVYFTEEGARQVTKMLANLKEMAEPSSVTLQYIQHVTSKFKAAVTIYWPSHHITNLIGDVFMNWYAGVNSTTAYNLATKVMKSQHGQYKDLESLSMLTSPDALRQAIEAAHSVQGEAKAVGNSTLFHMRNGERITPDMVATAAHRMGIMPTGRVLEDIDTQISSVLDKFQPLKGRGQRAMHSISETRDHWPRYAHFIDELMKTRKPFEEAIVDASDAVRKWHPDGMDLTRFERNTVKTILPFYSWMRKAVPLTIESILTAPAKVKAYPQLMEAIQVANGIQPEHGFDSPFPTDQLFTDWMREKGIGPIAGGPGNYTIYNPSIPANDVAASMFTPGKTIVSYLSPFIKVPIEAISGRELATGAEIGQPGGETWFDYYAKQTPVVNNIGRASGQFGVAPSVKGQGFPNTQNILNILTGLRKTNTGNYGKAAQFDLRDYLRSQRG